MDDRTWDLLIKKIDDLADDFREFKVNQREQMKELRSDQKEQMKVLSGLKVKVGAMGAIFGMIGAFIKSKLHL